MKAEKGEHGGKGTRLGKGGRKEWGDKMSRKIWEEKIEGGRYWDVSCVE